MNNKEEKLYFSFFFSPSSLLFRWIYVLLALISHPMQRIQYIFENTTSYITYLPEIVALVSHLCVAFLTSKRPKERWHQARQNERDEVLSQCWYSDKKRKNERRNTIPTKIYKKWTKTTRKKWEGKKRDDAPQKITRHKSLLMIYALRSCCAQVSSCFYFRSHAHDISYHNNENTHTFTNSQMKYSEWIKQWWIFAISSKPWTNDNCGISFNQIFQEEVILLEWNSDTWCYSKFHLLHSMNSMVW